MAKFAPPPAGLPAPKIAVNISAIQLRKADFVDTVLKAIAGDGVRAAIDLELTESLAMEDVQNNILKLQALSDSGIDIAIDDFGTGYSSLAYLAKLPIKCLKIDRAFIKDMVGDAKAISLVSTMINLAHSLDLYVVAEGVETEGQAKLLRQLDCDQIQGYLYGKPMPIEELKARIRGT